jgi:bacterioferritin-associated ferredoxin
MIVCVCHRISEKRVKQAIACGAASVSDVARTCGAGTDCGACCVEIRDMIQAKKKQTSTLLPSIVLAPAVPG